MPIDNDSYTVGTASAISIVPASNMEQNVLIHNNSSDSANIYIGGTDQIGTATGTLLTPEERISIDLGPGDEIFAISDTDGINVRVLRVTAD